MLIHEAHHLCKQHMGKMVKIDMHDGAVFIGVIEHVDHEHVFIVCPEDRVEGQEDRYFPYPGFGYPGFGYGPAYPYSYFYPRPRRFGLPLAGLAGLSLFPFFW